MIVAPIVAAFILGVSVGIVIFALVMRSARKKQLKGWIRGVRDL